jgi:hypothetical protein
MSEEWKSIGVGAEICTDSTFSEEDYGFFYEDFVLLDKLTNVEKVHEKPFLKFIPSVFKTTAVEPATFVTEVYKKENEEYSYIMVHHFDQQHNLINEVFLRFKL